MGDKEHQQMVGWAEAKDRRGKQEALSEQKLWNGEAVCKSSRNHVLVVK